jgi:hypothetical protein
VHAVSDIIDLQRYPIDRLDSTEATALIASCQEALEKSALCRFPGFILPAALEKIVLDESSLEDVAYPYAASRCAYLETDDSLPEDHPRNVGHFCSYRQVLNHQISNSSELRTVYSWPALTEFFRRILKIDSLYQSVCPHMSLTMHFAREGDGNGWHYDGNDFVVTLLLQAPDLGGEFEYAPNIRSNTDERYDAVTRLTEDPDHYAERPLLAPGTLTLFKGDLSLHRVRPVGETSRPRIIVVFSYDEQPGHVFPQGYIDEVRGFAASANPE